MEALDLVMEEVDIATACESEFFGKCAWSAIIGYSIMLIGALLWSDSESVDPYSSNMGVFGGGSSG